MWKRNSSAAGQARNNRPHCLIISMERISFQESRCLRHFLTDRGISHGAVGCLGDKAEVQHDFAAGDAMVNHPRYSYCKECRRLSPFALFLRLR